MIHQIIDLPPNTIGFNASWEITEKDFEEVLVPCVQHHAEKDRQLNFMLVLNTSLKNFRIGISLKNAWKQLRRLTKWKRAAIVIKSHGVKRLTNLVSGFIPLEFKAFSCDELQAAIDWVSGTRNPTIKASTAIEA